MEKKTTSQVRAVIFDFDNTLINTRKAIEEAYASTFTVINKRHGADISALTAEMNRIELENVTQVDRSKQSFKRSEWYRLLSKRLSLGLSESEITEYRDMFYAHIKKNVEFSRDTDYVLTSIKAMGKKLALLTERDDEIPGLKQERVKAMPFTNLFDVVVIAGETIPESKVTTVAAFSKTASLLKTPPQETLMVGDRLDIDIENGKEAGMQTVLFNAYADPRTGKHKPDYVISDIKQVLNIIR